MSDVTLEVIDLSTNQTVGTFALDICTPVTYELDLGDYQFKATYISTGEVLTQNITIAEGVNPELDFTFTPSPPSATHTLTINSTPIQGIPFTIEETI